MRTTELLPTRSLSASMEFAWNPASAFTINLINPAGDILFHLGFRLPERQIVLNRQARGEWGRQFKLFHEPRDSYALRLALERDRLTLVSGEDLLADVTGAQFSPADIDPQVSSIATSGLVSRWSVQDHEMFSRLLPLRLSGGPRTVRAEYKTLVVLCEDVFEAAKAPHVLADLWDADELWVYGRADRALCKIDPSRASPVQLYRQGCEVSHVLELLAERPGTLALLNLPPGKPPMPVWALPASARCAYAIPAEDGGQFPDPSKTWRATFKWDQDFPLTNLFGSLTLSPAFLLSAVNLEARGAGTPHPLMLSREGFEEEISAVYESPSVLCARLENGRSGGAPLPGNLSFKPGASVDQAFAQINSLVKLSGVESVAIASAALEAEWADVRFSLSSRRVLALHDGVKVVALFAPAPLFAELAQALRQRGSHALTLGSLLSHQGLDLLDDVLKAIRPQTTVARLLKHDLPSQAGAVLSLGPAASPASLEQIRQSLCAPRGQGVDLDSALSYLSYAAQLGDVAAMAALVETLHGQERNRELIRLAEKARRSPLARQAAYFDFVERLRELGYTGLAAALFPLEHVAPSERAYELGFDSLVRLGEFDAARRWREQHELQTSFVPLSRARQPERMGSELILAANHGDWAFVAEHRAVTAQLAADHGYYRSLQIMADIETGAYPEARAALAAFVRAAGETWESRRFALRIGEETGDPRGRRQALESIRKHEPELAPLFQPDNLFEVYGDPGLFAEADLCCICVVRNEMYRLPDFLRHYRALGLRHFAFIDNMSTDRTLEYLVEQPDVVVFRTPESYKASRFGVSWHNQIAKQFMIGKWVLTVDSDELLVFPGQDRIDLPGLCAELDADGYEVLFAPMIDMYSDKPLTASGFTPDKSLIEYFPYFDGDGYQHYWTPACAYRAITGGLRGRVFWNFRVKPSPQPPVLNKAPLVKFAPDTMYFSSTHEVTPRRVAPLTGALLHFKFLPDFHRRAVEEVRRQEHFAGAREYEIYMNKLHENPHSVFMYEGSTRYTGIDSLVRAGLVRTGSSLDTEPTSRIPPAAG